MDNISENEDLPTDSSSEALTTEYSNTIAENKELELSDSFQKLSVSSDSEAPITECGIAIPQNEELETSASSENLSISSDSEAPITECGNTIPQNEELEISAKLQNLSITLDSDAPITECGSASPQNEVLEISASFENLSITSDSEEAPITECGSAIAQNEVLKTSAKVQNLLAVTDSEMNAYRTGYITDDESVSTETDEWYTHGDMVNLSTEGAESSSDNDCLTQRELDLSARLKKLIVSPKADLNVKESLLGYDSFSGCLGMIMELRADPPTHIRSTPRISVNWGLHRVPNVHRDEDDKGPISSVHEDTDYFSGINESEIMHDFGYAKADEATTNWGISPEKEFLTIIAVPAYNTLVGLVFGLTYAPSSLYIAQRGYGGTLHMECSYNKLECIDDKIPVMPIKSGGHGGTSTECNLMKPEDMQNLNMDPNPYDHYGDPSVALLLLLWASIGAIFATVTMRPKSLLRGLKWSTYVVLLGLTLQAINGEPAIQTFTHILCGSAVGYGTSTSIVWIAENNEPEMLSVMLSSIPLFVTVGILATYNMVIAVMLLFIAFGVFSLLARFETKTFGKTENLSCQPHEVNEATERMSHIFVTEERGKIESINMFLTAMKPFLLPTFYKPIIILCSLLLLQQFCGPIFAVFLAIKLFKEYSCELDQETYSFYVALESVAAAFVFIFFFKLAKSHRRIFLTSQMFLIYITFLIGLSCLILDGYDVKEMPEDFRCVPGVLAYGMGLVSLAGAFTLPIVTCSRMFTKPCRAVGTGICMAAFCLSSALILTPAAYQPMIDSLGYHSTVFLLFPASFSCFLFAILLLPETKGVTFNELKVHFFNGWFYHHL